MTEPEQQPEGIKGRSSKVDFDLKPFIDATADASRRAHNLVLLLTASSILLAMGVINSTNLSWPRMRFNEISKPHSKYTELFFEDVPPPQRELEYPTIVSNFHR